MRKPPPKATDEQPGDHAAVHHDGHRAQCPPGAGPTSGHYLIAVIDALKAVPLPHHPPREEQTGYADSREDPSVHRSSVHRFG